MAEAGEGSPNTGEQRSDRDEPVADYAVRHAGRLPVLERGVHGATHQEDHGIKVDERTEGPNPGPFHDPTGEPVRLHERRVDRSQEHERGRHQRHAEHDGREPVRFLPVQQQVHRALGQRKPSEQSPRDVPGPEQRLLPADQRGKGLRDRAGGEGEDPDRPPEMVHAAQLTVPAKQKGTEPDREDARDDGDEVHEAAHCCPFPSSVRKRPGLGSGGVSRSAGCSGRSVRRAPPNAEPAPSRLPPGHSNQNVEVQPIRKVLRGCGRKNVAFENSAYSASVKFSRLAVM